MNECVCMCPLVRLSCHVCCLSSSSYPASSCSSYVQGPCQHIGTSGQCRCIADRGRDGSAVAGHVNPRSHRPCLLFLGMQCWASARCVLCPALVRPSSWCVWYGSMNGWMDGVGTGCRSGASLQQRLVWEGVQRIGSGVAFPPWQVALFHTWDGWISCS